MWTSIYLLALYASAADGAGGSRIVVLANESEVSNEAISKEPHEALPPLFGKARRSGLIVNDSTGWLLGQRKDPYHARITADCGLRSVAEADFGRDHISVFKMKSPLAALCAFANEKTLDAVRLDSLQGAEIEGYRVGGRYVARTAEFVVVQRTAGANTSPALLESVIAELPHLAERDPEIASLDVLPTNDRIPSSSRFVAVNALGWTSLGSGFAADFACGGGAATVVSLNLSDNSRSTISGFQREAEGRGATSSHFTTSGAELWSAPLGEAEFVYLVRVGGKLAAIESDTAISQCDGLLVDVVAHLRTAATLASN